MNSDLIILGGDNEISLYWLLTDKHHLDVFCRNKVSQFRYNSDLSYGYHVTTENNLADLGTRVDLTSFDANELGPAGKWHNGLPWMTMNSVDKMVDNGILILDTRF